MLLYNVCEKESGFQHKLVKSNFFHLLIIHLTIASYNYDKNKIFCIQSKEWSKNKVKMRLNQSLALEWFFFIGPDIHGT